MNLTPEYNDELKASDISAEAHRYSRALINEMVQALVTRSAGTDCMAKDLGDLQIKVHAPKQGNRHISYEFYGSDLEPEASLGCDYTKKEAIALLAEFLRGDWRRPIYKPRWEKIAECAGVAVRSWLPEGEVEQ